MGSNKFLPLGRPTLIIASSSDVLRARELAEYSLGKLGAQFAVDELIEIYSWDIDDKMEVVDQRVSYQENIPHPADPLCRGVVCIIGERLGHPLEWTFDLNEIEDIDIWIDESQKYRLVHPWPVDDEAEQDKLLKAGQFPLTGTVFEFLAACGAGKPVLLSNLSDQPITLENDDVKLGGLQWMREKTNELTDGTLSVVEYQSWINTDYRRQSTAVKNFLKAMVVRGRALNHLVQLESLTSQLEVFFKENILQGRGSGEGDRSNPYRYLDYYDIHDSADYIGREKTIDKAVAGLRDRLEKRDQPSTLRIDGESGCGKSSFLRAGFLGRLINKKNRGLFRASAFRPLEFRDNNPGGILQLLLELISAEHVDILPSAQDMKKLRSSGIKAPEVAVQILEENLPTARDGSSATLVLGFDQFEEIVDDLISESTDNIWLPLVEFIQKASFSSSLAVAFTLESTRKESFDTLKLGPAFSNAERVSLSGLSDELISEIIEIPFARSGFRLGNDIICQLINEVSDYKTGDKETASCLPLLSLKLSSFFDYIQQQRAFIVERQNKEIANPFGLGTLTTTKSDIIGLSDISFDLSIKDEISDLVNTAWSDTYQTAEDELEALDKFLQPFVKLGGLNGNHILLEAAELPEYHTDRGIAECFGEVRLLVRQSSRWRLVHEAVLREWPLAVQWIDSKSDLLKLETILTHKAHAWHASGRDPSVVPKDRKSIDEAVKILQMYHRYWLGESTPLDETGTILRDYTIAIFRNSDRPIGKEPPHDVHLAASYNLSDLLDTFYSIDSECFDVAGKNGRLPLGQAVWSGLASVDVILQRTAEPSLNTEDGWPIIAAPIITGNREIFNRLLPLYNNLGSITGPNDTSLLLTCAEHDRTDMAQQLIDKFGSEILSEKSTVTPLHTSASTGTENAFEFFLKLCDFNAVESSGRTILHLASENGRDHIVKRILAMNDGAIMATTIDSTGQTPLHLASANRHASSVRLLLEFSDPNLPVIEVETDTKSTTQKDRVGLAPLHLAIGIDSYQLPLPKTRSSRADAQQTVRELLADKRIDPNIRTATGQTSFSLATRLPNVRRELLLHKKFQVADTVLEGKTTLLYAVVDDDRGLVEQILAADSIDPEIPSEDGTRAPELMIQQGMGDVVLKLLVQGKLNPWPEDEQSKGLLYESIEKGETEIVDWLLDNTPSTLNKTVLMHLSNAIGAAIAKDDKGELISRLLFAGADPNLADHSGYTPLNIASMFGNLAVMDCLLANKQTDRHAKDNWGRSAVDFAPDLLIEEVMSRIGLEPTWIGWEGK